MKKKTAQALEIIAKNFFTQPIEDVGIRVKRPEYLKAIIKEAKKKENKKMSL